VLAELPHQLRSVHDQRRGSASSLSSSRYCSVNRIIGTLTQHQFPSQHYLSFNGILSTRTQCQFPKQHYRCPSRHVRIILHVTGTIRQHVPVPASASSAPGSEPYRILPAVCRVAVLCRSSLVECCALRVAEVHTQATATRAGAKLGDPIKVPAERGRPWGVRIGVCARARVRAATRIRTSRRTARLLSLRPWAAASVRSRYRRRPIAPRSVTRARPQQPVAHPKHNGMHFFVRSRRSPHRLCGLSARALPA
jgi:hypothetical protein